MEPEGSLPHSKTPATCPCPKPDQSNPCLPIAFLHYQFSYYPPIYGQVIPAVSFPQASPPKLCMHISSPHTSHIPCQSHSSFECLNEFWQGIHSIMKLFIIQSPVTISLQGPHILLSTRNICSSLNVSMCSSQH